MSSIDIYSAISVSQSKTDIFISKATNIHFDKYDYKDVKYINAKANIAIICKIHSVFYQTPNSHLKGRGCPLCNKFTTSNILTFIDKANIVHHNKYNYSESVYTKSFNKIKIICNLHGEFYQKASSHLYGCGCPKCCNNISKLSTSWLNSLNISDMICEHRLHENRYKAVDGYSPSTNTVYQFHGDYWHGNPLKFNSQDVNPSRNISYGELYTTTIDSDNYIISLGYNLITMWESNLI